MLNLSAELTARTRPSTSTISTPAEPTISTPRAPSPGPTRSHFLPLPHAPRQQQDHLAAFEFGACASPPVPALLSRQRRQNAMRRMTRLACSPDTDVGADALDWEEDESAVFGLPSPVQASAPAEPFSSTRQSSDEVAPDHDAGNAVQESEGALAESVPDRSVSGIDASHASVKTERAEDDDEPGTESTTLKVTRIAQLEAQLGEMQAAYQAHALELEAYKRLAREAQHQAAAAQDAAEKAVLEVDKLKALGESRAIPLKTGPGCAECQCVCSRRQYKISRRPPSRARPRPLLGVQAFVRTRADLAPRADSGSRSCSRSSSLSC
jgi:hypothetical protein